MQRLVGGPGGCRARLAPRTLVCAFVLAAALLTAISTPSPAPARQAGTCIKLGDRIIPITPGLDLRLLKLQGGVVVDCPPGQSPLPDLPRPSVPATPTTPTSPAPRRPSAPPASPGARKPGARETRPRRTRGRGLTKLGRNDGGRRARERAGRGGSPHKLRFKRLKATKRGRRERARPARPAPMRLRDGSPARSNPGFMDTFPGPSYETGVPNFVIRKFRVPPFLLPIYQAAGIQYGVRWEVLAAINEIETDYGRNLNVSSAGALGWMQFIPSSWRIYGVDANRDGRKDPYNPVDAIFASARYLKAAGYAKDPRGAVFAYNHADWYVDSVMLRARLISGVPADVVGSLTGLTEGRFPVAARARYADDAREREQRRRVRGRGGADDAASDAGRSKIDVFARDGAPVVATNDGVIKKIGNNRRLGRFVVLQDVYGNRYTYAGLGRVARLYAAPRSAGGDPRRQARALAANDRRVRAPRSAASAGRQPEPRRASRHRRRADVKRPAADRRASPSAAVKQRLFAHPDMPQARESGGLEQLIDSREDAGAGGTETYRNYFARPLSAGSKDVRLRRLREGSHVIGGAILGRVGKPDSRASHLEFSIRPAGKGAPKIDPKPILDGWKLLEDTAIYRASGRNVLRGKDGLSVGQVLLLPKPLLERRVLGDERIDVYDGGRSDIRAGQVDRRVLATLAFLAESGMRPSVSCLRAGHGYMTASGNVSEHSSGNAVDIASINGVPILGHQEPGGITEQAVRRLMTLQGTVTPHQIISLLDLGANTLSLSDHADHIHVGFRPRFGENRRLGRQTMAVLEPGQWSDLSSQLRRIENPVVPTSPSKYAIPVGRRASEAHRGD